MAMTVVARGVRVDLYAWERIYRTATARGMGVVRFAGRLLERAADVELGQPLPALPVPKHLDAWKAVPPAARRLVRNSLESDADLFRDQYVEGDDPMIDAHIAALLALRDILDRAEAE
jgi:hypothetical protein